MNVFTTMASSRPAQILLVSYDLKTAGWNYTPFYEALKQQGAWWHYLTATWLVATNKSPQEVYTALGQFLSKQDLILIAPITRPYWGYLPKDAWDWIEKNLSSGFPSNPLALTPPPP